MAACCMGSFFRSPAAHKHALPGIVAKVLSHCVSVTSVSGTFCRFLRELNRFWVKMEHKHWPHRRRIFSVLALRTYGTTCRSFWITLDKRCSCNCYLLSSICNTRGCMLHIYSELAAWLHPLRVDHTVADSLNWWHRSVQNIVRAITPEPLSPASQSQVVIVSSPGRRPRISTVPSAAAG